MHCTALGSQPQWHIALYIPICKLLLASLSCRGLDNGNYGALVEAALCTLPEPDQQAVMQAEVECSSWAQYVHAHPGQSYGDHCSLDRFFTNLRVVILTAAFSHFAFCTVLDHLAGRLPMDDWEELEQVGTKQSKGNNKPLCACMADSVVVNSVWRIPLCRNSAHVNKCPPIMYLSSLVGCAVSAPSCCSARLPAPGTVNHCSTHYALVTAVESCAV